MAAATSSHPALEIWERAIAPGRKGLDEAAARALLGIRLSKRDRDRAEALAAKSCSGQLTESEALELESVRTVGTALEFLKSKARRSIAKETP
jgi:hypothetical protein